MTELTLPPLVWVASTQMLLYALAWLLCAALLREPRRAVAHWGGSMLAMAAAGLLLALRNEPHGERAYPGAELLLVVGWVLVRRGHELFMHQQPADREHLAWVGGVALGLLLLGPQADAARWRAGLLGAASAVIALRCQLTLAHRVRAEYGPWPSLLIGLPAGLVLAGGLGIGLGFGFGLQFLPLEWSRARGLTDAGSERVGLIVLGLVGAAAFNISHMTMLTLRLTRRLQAAALQDSLTGLPNRRVIEARLKHEWRRWCRHAAPFSVLALELDQFRRINDFWGHAAGDELLVQIGQRLQSRLRALDSVARTGGTEFLLLLPDTDQAASRVAAERLRAGVADEPYRVRGQSLQMTVSIGLAQVRGSDADVETLLARAQAALRRAKAQGRDRVCDVEAPVLVAAAEPENAGEAEPR